MRRVRTAAAVTAAVLLAGCGATASRVAVGSTPPAPTAPVLLVAQAEAALAESDAPAAISFAELAVRANPADVNARRALARYYLAAGRFRAAAEAYDDLVAIDPGSTDARLKQGVALLAAGRTAAGVAVIEASGAPVADRGLALALAGEVGPAVVLLDDAARMPGAGARVRQNLALAQALAGRWTQARIIASQDLSPADLDARLRAWASLAAGDAASRTRAFLAVDAAPSDAGRPAELAYRRSGEPQPVMVAEAAPAPKLAAAESAAPAFVTIRRVAPPDLRPATEGGRWVVQLGAFPDEGARADSWRRMRSDVADLANFQPILTRATLPNRGTFHRLAVGNFEKRRGAVDLCLALRAEGRSCFVRRQPTTEAAPIRMASRT
jgi:Flp pilus assembly protein TadD